MKKLLMAAVALICMTVTSVALIACGGDDDKDDSKAYSYAITVEFKSLSYETPLDESGNDEVISSWVNSILSVYKGALGVNTESFTLNGTQSECDKKVLDACKKAETPVATIKGGSGTVTVKNITANKTVYTYQVQP